MELYFAYGSNLLYEQMRERCSSASFGTLAYYPNFKLDFTRKSTKGGWVADMPRLLYMNKILKGARQQKLPVDYIDFLESIKTTEV